MLLDGLLRRLVQEGSLTLIDPDGRIRRYGTPPGYHAAIRVHDWRTARAIWLRPDPAVAEAYMDGRLTIEEGDLLDFLMLGAINHARVGRVGPERLFSRLDRALRRFYMANDRRRAARNIHHHYDLSGELYALFLDEERQYTCAYHPTGHETLEQAQRAKERHIAAKLLLEPGMRVVDLGCGWGALAIHLARHHGVDVTAVTLSVEQARWANARARALGLEDRVRFLHQDYREVTGTYDRVVSIGMLEHVGISRFDKVFNRIRDLLKPDGVALVHAIGRAAGPGYTSAFIRRHIFPGGYIPALSEVLPSVERSGLWLTDCEILRLHYAETLKLWRQRFRANWARAAALYDERFCRMWDFYLAGSEVFFRAQDGMNFQLQLARDRHVVPLVRDYMVDEERAQPRHAAAALAHRRAAE